LKVEPSRYKNASAKTDGVVGDLLAKNCVFLLPLSYSAPSVPIFPLEFCGEVKREETRVMGLSCSADPMIVAGVVLTQCQRVTDGRTDGQMDGFTIASTALCIASYADALMPTRCNKINRAIIRMLNDDDDDGDDVALLGNGIICY